MMDKIGEDGLVVDGRKLFFEYRFLHFIPIIKASLNLIRLVFV